MSDSTVVNTSVEASDSLSITTPTDREVVMTRVFDAPRQLVFDALTRPDLLKRWLDAPGRSLELCEIDLRVGGAYRYVWRGAGKKDVGTRGVFREIVRGQRLVQTESWEDWDAGETSVTTVLVEKNGRTTLTSTVLFPSKEVRDTILKSGMEPGARQQYDRLAEVLASIDPATQDAASNA
jgi:uncharacterized protein YndB with AHSA1/START domain